jgi:hypothetical protein
MSKQQSSRGRRIVIFSILTAVILAAVGFGVAGATGSPSSILTCTSSRSGKIKLVTAGPCHKGSTLDTWDNDATVVQPLQQQLAAATAQVNTLTTAIANQANLCADIWASLNATATGDAVTLQTAEGDFSPSFPALLPLACPGYAW